MANEGEMRLRPASVRMRAAARILAVQFLYQIETDLIDALENLAEFEQHYAGDVLGELEIDSIDKEHFQHLATLVVSHQDALDTQIAQYLGDDWTIERLARIDRTLLRAGLAELMHMPHVPVKAALSEYAGLCDVYQGDVRFVNAVLDKLASDHRKAELAAKSS